MTSEVAKTILAQLGGNRFLTMTGAKDLVGGETYLSMRVPNARYGDRRVSHVKINLDPSDTYTVYAVRCTVARITPIATETAVYCDTLQQTFTRLTGLETHL